MAPTADTDLVRGGRARREYSLDEYRDAVETAIDRENSHAIKVVFRP